MVGGGLGLNDFETDGLLLLDGDKLLDMLLDGLGEMLREGLNDFETDGLLLLDGDKLLDAYRLLYELLKLGCDIFGLYIESLTLDLGSLDG